MGGKDERMCVDKFRNLGFGAFRYAQPAIHVPMRQPGEGVADKYRRQIQYRKVSRKQPVDGVAAGRVRIADLNKTYDMHFGFEEKTCSGDYFYPNTIRDENHFRFVKFCHDNLLMPLYIVVFRWGSDIRYWGTINVHCLPERISIKDACRTFDEFVEKICREYAEYVDKDTLNFDIINIEHTESLEEAIDQFNRELSNDGR